MRALFAGMSAAIAFAAAGSAIAQIPLELAIKATYLYKFAPFVEWPAATFYAPAAPINICVVGADPFGPTLDQAVAGQRLATHPIAIRRVADAAPECQIAFIAGADTFVARALKAFQGQPVLTVTDVAPDAAVHGIINFVTDAHHVRFDIDDEAAAANGLTVSSKLLTLARAVRPR